MMKIKKRGFDMVTFIIILLAIAIFAFYLSHKADKRIKQDRQRHQTTSTQHKPYVPYYPRTQYKIYPELNYESVNIMTKKARKQYTEFVVIDFETTGLNPTSDKIIEIGAVKICNGSITDSFSTLVNPKRSIPAAATRVNGITDQMIKDAPQIESVLPQLIQFIGDKVIVAHNAPFDMKFLLVNAFDCGIEIKNPVIDTLSLSRKMFTDIANHKLGTVARHLCVNMDQAHRSLCDVTVTANILIKCIDILERQDIAKDQERKLAKEAAKALAEREGNVS